MKVFVTILLFILVTSCAQMRSGRYIKLTKQESAESLSERFSISKTDIENSNLNTKFQKDDWVFIPSNRGVIQYLDSINRKPAQSEIQAKNIDDDNETDRSDLGTSIDPRSTGFLWPVPSSRRVSSAYGQRGDRSHEGIDIAAPVGSSILSVDDGVVIYSGQDLSGYGNITVIAHRHGYFSVYAHAMKNYTNKGQKVYKGQVIALVGMTGRSTGPHLHFEIRRNSEACDPEVLLSEKML